jgi:hypothetical protein
MAARSQQTKVLLEKHTNNQLKNLVFQELQNQVRQQLCSLHNHLVQKVENHQSTLVDK